MERLLNEIDAWYDDPNGVALAPDADFFRYTGGYLWNEDPVQTVRSIRIDSRHERLRIVIEAGCLYDTAMDGHWARWLITATGLVESLLEVGSVERPEFYSDHPFLAKETDPDGWISFSAPFANPYDALGRLWHAHREQGGHPMAFSDFVREELLFAPRGILCTGPERFMRAYHEVLVEGGYDVGLTVMTSRGHEPREVLVLGDRYVIAESFSVTRIA